LQALKRAYLVKDRRHGKQVFDEVNGPDVVALLDLRFADEYEAGHLPGAVNMPADELDAHRRQIPKNKSVIAYCRGPWCITAVNAVRQLRARGHKARRIPWGVNEWENTRRKLATAHAQKER